MTVNRINPWALGATLYTPATHSHLGEVLAGQRLESARSLVVCLEDAVREDEVECGLENLGRATTVWRASAQHRFIRVRNPDMVARIVRTVPWRMFVGLVLPKVTAANLSEYVRHLPDDCPWVVMPTLETAEVFDTQDLRQIRQQLRAIQERVLMLRIGGNDLLHQLGMRRPKSGTIYDTPLDTAICRLVQMFKPDGYHLSAPVFEMVDRMELLEEEVEQDLAHGLTCKTAIHPSQIAVIESWYSVPHQDAEQAEAILDPSAPAVFRLHGTMCEPATHRRWAEQMRARAEFYGTS